VSPNVRLFVAGCAGIFAFGTAGCDNMQHQAAGPDRARGADARADVPLPPAHVVARASRDAAGGADSDRLEEKTGRRIDAAMLERGRDRHEIYCAPCHGSDGYGRGMVVRRGFPAPPSYHDARLRAAPDGEIYAAIARGSGRMLSLADRLTPADRWAVVAYVRALQLSQSALAAGLPATDRAHLEGSP
jgi:mono/diheme cytochrome c family protein